MDLLYLHNAAEAQLVAVGREVFSQRLLDAFRFREGERREGVREGGRVREEEGGGGRGREGEGG